MTHTEPKSGLDFRGARYLISAPSLKHCPPDCAREAAFMGRSNAGKSSAINALTGQTGLARTSKTPGRTQLLNYFELAPERYLVDLPGFGYAKVPPAMKRQWQTQIELYLRERRSLCGLVLLMDIRHPFRDYDMQMIEWARQAGLPLHVLLTKSDKLSRGAAKAALLQARRTLAEYGEKASVQLLSSLKAEGVPELKRTLNDWLCPREADDRQGAAQAEKEEEREVPDGQAGEGELFDPPNESEP